MIIILSDIFILIGGIILSAINFIKNLSFKKDNTEKQEHNEITSSIFSKLNLEVETPKAKKKTKLDEIRDILFNYMVNKSVLVVLVVILLILTITTSLELSAIYLVIIVMLYVFIFYYPQMKVQRSYSDLNQELPYALRHMSIELKSGSGLHDAMQSISEANYGSLSDEFKRVLEEIKFGKSSEDSLLDMSHRVKSDGLSRAIQQLIGTQRVGGNLAISLEVIAKDIVFDMNIKLKEFSQKLNSFILIYTFISILAPVISLIMLMAGSTVMGDIIPTNLLFLIYAFFFPLIVMFMGILIKRLEPKI